VEWARPRELPRAQSCADSSVGLSQSRLTRESAILCCILAVSAMVYLRCLENAFVLDDTVMFVRNPDLGHWSFLWKAFTRNEFWYSNADILQNQQYRNYRPLLLVWYWMDYHLFGLNPAPWHASIVAMHLLAVWLVFKIACRLGGDSTSALLAAAMFALTPIHVAAVVWLAACGMVLGTVLTLGAFYFIMPRAEGSARNWLAALVLYAGALMCHESITVFPALVACYAFLFYDNGDAIESSGTTFWMRARRAFIWQAPFAAELLIYMVVRRLVLGFFVSNPYDTQNLLTNVQAVLTVPSVLVTYIDMLAMPWLTLPIHRVFPVSSPMSPEFWLPLAAIAMVLAAVVLVVMYDPKRRLYLFCAAWIGITLAPMMALHSVPHLVQDYCLYLPSVAWCWLVGDLIAGVARKNVFAWRLAVGAATAMLIVYAVTLWKVQWFWHDDVAAARGYVEGFPESVRWHWALATRLDEQGDLAGAEDEIRTALRLEPDMTGINHPHSAELHHFLGELLARRGDIDGAVLELGQSLNGPPDEDELHPSQPPLAYDHRGISLYDQAVSDANAGRTNQAIQEITEGLETMRKAPVPDYGPMAMRYVKLAELYDSIGDQGKVESVLKEVDSMSEGELAVGVACATIRLNHSDKEGAERILSELSRSYPTSWDVLLPLGDLEFGFNQYKEALDSYQRADAGWFGGADMHLSIAQSLHALGRNQEAADQCRLAQALSPPDWAKESSCAEIRNDQQGTR
jgi:tetratricopeptide (TPR) repeat protein